MDSRTCQSATATPGGRHGEGPFAYPIHPGDTLKIEFMEPLGLSGYRLATDLRVSAPRVNDIVRGRRAITADPAMRLSAYFGCSAQLWLNL